MNTKMLTVRSRVLRVMYRRLVKRKEMLSMSVVFIGCFMKKDSVRRLTIVPVMEMKPVKTEKNVSSVFIFSPFLSSRVLLTNFLYSY